MINNTHKLEKFYRDLERHEQLSLEERFQIFDMLHKEAVELGVITSENILEGIEVDLRIARAINGLRQ